MDQEAFEVVVSEQQQDRVRRSTLVVAVDRPKHVAGADRAGGDQMLFNLADLEPSRKDVGREAVVEALEATDHGEALVSPRINAIGTMWAYRDIVDLVERVGEFVDCIVIPEVLAPGDVEFVDTLVGMIEQRLDLAHQIGIEAEIATPQALALLDEIALASDRMEALVLDEAGIAAALGIGSSVADDALGTIRLQVLVAARAAELQAVVAPDIQDADPDTYRSAIERAQALGYDGARCTHPSQVEIANQVFARA